MNEQLDGKGMGWKRDLPDDRDYHPDSDAISKRSVHKGDKRTVKSLLTTVGTARPLEAVPAAVDLRPWCSPIENQGALGACTAHAGISLYEYFEKRAFGKHIDASRRFLYKTTRNMLGWSGDTGAYLRTTMGALAIFGTPPEEYWPYNLASYDLEPTPFCYAFAQSFQALTYYRLDPIGITPPVLLARIKSHLVAGLPSMFGFTVFTSISEANSSGKIPCPMPADRIAGGHAVAAVGYDDSVKIKHSSPLALETTGAFLIRNSWGTGWGAAGYGWLPYEYVLRGLAVDWWTMIKGEWIDSKQFKA